MSGLIETEKRTFDARYSYIGEYFRMKPNPRWERAKAVRYDDGALDVFVLCGNTDAEKIFDNDLVLVIMKRGSVVSSFIKFLPYDESYKGRLHFIPTGEKVFLEIDSISDNGCVISVNAGFFSRRSQVSTRLSSYIQCEEIKTTYKTTTEHVINGSELTPLTFTIEREYVDLRLDCESGVGNGVSAPEAGGGGVGIPSSWPFPGTSGSGNTGGGSSGNSGSSSGSGYTGGGSYGGGYYGGGASEGGNYGGGSGSSGGSNNLCPGCDHPQLPEGGFNMLPLDHIADSELQDQDHDPYAELKAQIRKEESKLIEGVEKYTPWPGGVSLKAGEFCDANARVREGNIEICTRFFQDELLTDKDRISILYHEVYHIRHHDTFKDFVPHRLPAKITLRNVPPEFKQFIIDHVVYGKYFSAAENENMYLEEISFSEINPPEYYRNEIEAYENEIRTVTDVSDYYDTQRRYMLWRVKQLYDISKKYYGK